MTPTQLELIKGEFFKEFVKDSGKDIEPSFIDPNGSVSPVWQWFESKLEEVEVIRGLENFKITMEEIEKARDEATGKDWYVQNDELVVKKGSYVIYRIDLKSNKLEK